MPWSAGGEATTIMRVNLKPAAATAAASVLLLLILHLTWPGHGIWLLLVGILVGLTAAYVWWREQVWSAQAGSPAGHAAPFSDVGAYGLSGAALESPRPAARTAGAAGAAGGVSLSLVLAPISVLAMLLYIGGAIGSTGSAAGADAALLHENVSVIDRSGDGEPATPLPESPAGDPSRRTQSATALTSISPPRNSATTPQAATTQQQPAAPVRPIVVAAPQAASPLDEEPADANLPPESANTFEYVVEEGDTLYDIALRYDSTVEAIMSLNKLDSFSFIHPGDVLLIPILDQAAEES